MSHSKVVLTKVFSREKPLFYLQLWKDSDRLGFKKFLDHDMAHMVFLEPGPNKKGSVWYGKQEWAELSAHRKRIFAENPERFGQIQVHLDEYWERLMPYLSETKPISAREDFADYYALLVTWWAGMTAVFEVSDDDNAPQFAKDMILARRSVSEKYTEKMSKLMLGYWEKEFPDLGHLMFFVTPQEAIELALRRDHTLLKTLEARLRGCIMINDEIYPIDEQDQRLSESGYVLEELIDTGAQVKGNVAYRGKVEGAVRIIASNSDFQDFRPGEILITEMTNPDYVPIMKIAGAVVTDEGGMTCHAAIATREMKVPCIVGTRIATKSFKTGDIVEVDANTGIVRKI